MEEFEFTWEVLEIFTEDQRRGVLVRYTPERNDCSIVEKFVPVPFHKARDKHHAREIMEKKISSYAPTREWAKECFEDESGDTETIGAELASELGVNHASESARRPAAEPFDARGSADGDRVSEPGGSEGLGSGGDGDSEGEATPDSEQPAGPGPATRRRRRR